MKAIEKIAVLIPFIGIPFAATYIWQGKMSWLIDPKNTFLYWFWGADCFCHI